MRVAANTNTHALEWLSLLTARTRTVYKDLGMQEDYKPPKGPRVQKLIDMFNQKPDFPPMKPESRPDDGAYTSSLNWTPKREDYDEYESSVSETSSGNYSTEVTSDSLLEAAAPPSVEPSLPEHGASRIMNRRKISPSFRFSDARLRRNTTMADMLDAIRRKKLLERARKRASDVSPV
ncbi:MAG: uncharacterized protein KVP18_003635 [Porospora cf. gigantea A]|uniref:uncharacterized protein n=1 Tax=Porospora cf. gigantea A TaxID=2853593 RepID=UPI00355949AD|nr:MAG: hypothetical protein KVP18_003635 [Porospora cf. gigantea A]